MSAIEKRLAVVRPEPGDLPLSRIAALYLQDLRGRSSRHHVRTVRGMLDQVIGHVGDIGSSVVDQPLMRAYRAVRINAGLSLRTVNLEAQVTERALRWAVDAGHIEENKLAGLPALKVRPQDTRKKRRAMTDEEYEEFVAAARADDEKAKRAGRRKIPQTPLYLTLLGSGGRRKEVLQTRWRHWDFEPEGLEGDELEGAALVTFVDTKNGNERALPIAPDVAAEVKGLREMHTRALGKAPKPADFVFLSPTGVPFAPASRGNTLRVFYRILEKAGIPRDVDGRTVDMHACRMTFCSRLQRAGVELGTRQELLGHSDPALTEKMYSDVGERESFAALRQLLIRELSTHGIDAEEAEEALRAIGLGSALASASPKTRLMVNGGSPWTGIDDQLPKLNVEGSSPFARSKEADGQPTSPPKGEPQSPLKADLTVVQTALIATGRILVVLLVGSSPQPRERGGRNCDHERDNEERGRGHTPQD
ncbi:MAG: tyrosine-type recombinase/integrase [bacterium]|nr:tyrosine-type recombinase/integrase [bacterium]